MYLFDKRFVHFMWNDKLKGKKCFLEDEIDVLRVTVEKGVESDLHSIVFSRNESAPFRIADGLYNWQFAYYDPNYEVKKAFNKGKKVQVRCAACSWKDCDEPKWYDDCAYRVKPDCPCEDGIDPKACVGCEHSEDGKPEYKPYETVEEFIQDYQERFPTAVGQDEACAYCEVKDIFRNKAQCSRPNKCKDFVFNEIDALGFDLEKKYKPRGEKQVDNSPLLFDMGEK